MSLNAALAKSNEPRVSVLGDKLFAELAPAEFGTLFTFQDLRKILFEDPQSSRGNRAIQRAKRRLLREQHKSLVSVRDQGYQVSYPNEHAQQSKCKAKASLRRQREALALVLHVEKSKLSPQERQHVEDLTNRYALTIALTTRLSRAKSLPARAEAKLPSGKQLAEMLKKDDKKIH
jgi:hypothetical protein